MSRRTKYAYSNIRVSSTERLWILSRACRRCGSKIAGPSAGSNRSNSNNNRTKHRGRKSPPGIRATIRPLEKVLRLLPRPRLLRRCLPQHLCKYRFTLIYFFCIKLELSSFLFHEKRISFNTNAKINRRSNDDDRCSASYIITFEDARVIPLYRVSICNICFFIVLIYFCRSGGTGGSAASSPALLRDSPQYKPAGSATSLLLATSTTPPSVSYRPKTRSLKTFYPRWIRASESCRLFS